MNDVLITNALLFDGLSAELVPAELHLIDGRIAEIGMGLRPGPGTLELDARGRVVSPGLSDAHFHAYAVEIRTEVLETMPLSYVALAAQHRLAAALRRGFTTVRDVAGGDAGIGEAIRRGLIVSPHYLYTGAALSQSGGHSDWRRVLDPGCARHGGHTVEVVDGVEPLRRVVRERFRTGAHAIKIMTSGGVASYTDPIRSPQYSADEVRAVTEEASRRGSYVAAHAYSPEAIAHSITAGVRSIEHGNLIDAATARLMAEAGAFLVPTLAAYDAMDRRGEALAMDPIVRAKNLEVLEFGAHAIELAVDAGVRLGFGTDQLGELADDQLRGIRLHAEVLGPLATLRSAIHGNAELFHPQGAPDPLEEGAPADLVVWNGDPLADLALVWDESAPRTVLLGGRVVWDGLELAR